LFYFVVFEAMFFDSISTTNSTTNSSDASKGIMSRSFIAVAQSKTTK